MRALKVLTIAMGIAIVVATAALAVLIARRLSAPVRPPSYTAALREQAGARIAGVAGLQDRLAVWIQGGGPDRILLLDPRSGDVTGTVTLQNEAP